MIIFFSYIIILICLHYKRTGEGRGNTQMYCISNVLLTMFYSIRAMTNLARTAIENEQKVQQQLILEDKDFVVDWVNHQDSRFMI